MSNKKHKFDSIEDAIKDIKAWKMVIVVDDEDRENEGDFIMASESIIPESINFISKYGRGLICVAISENISNSLDLKPMVQDNTDIQSTNFTVSIDHKPTNTTWISASDRANTIKALVDEDTKPSDFSRPGHIFPLIAKNWWVLRRAWHTEATVDLAMLAGFKRSGVLCEIMNDDWEMARRDDLFKVAKQHDLRIITIADLISYKRNKEKFIEEVSIVDMPTKFWNFKLHTYINKYNPSEHHIALTMWDIDSWEPCLLRVHSECLTWDVFGSNRCDCWPQLTQALEKISKEWRGVLVYLRQEWRWIGFVNKMKAYEFQEQWFDTIEANEKVWFKADLRDYGFWAQIINSLWIKKIKLITNNPKKVVGLKWYDIEITEEVSIEVKCNIHNEKYLKTKRDRMWHNVLLHEHI